jgi:hypothetical protein
MSFYSRFQPVLHRQVITPAIKHDNYIHRKAVFTVNRQPGWLYLVAGVIIGKVTRIAYRLYLQVLEVDGKWIKANIIKQSKGILTNQAPSDTKSKVWTQTLNTSLVAPGAEKADANK